MHRASVTMFVLVRAVTYGGKYELKRKKVEAQNWLKFSRFL